MFNYSTEPARGLYDPRFEHDGCGVGFVAHIKGRKTHGVIEDALRILINLAHRGACGCDPETGDGAGILVQMPHEFMRTAAATAGFQLPSYSEYGTGLVFLPKDPNQRSVCEQLVEQTIEEENQILLGWRDLPVNRQALGPL